ncbi:glyoxylate/hydroxypyruvate reductase A-like isoform X2 [Apostichopus japonicus]|uniref:glyoxylate/hydroxypyruvate reductase A-like isoform X2 n=1 Tax=Stichopus japonicus TaxID=307972 RepID=UPI003AB4AAD7
MYSGTVLNSWLHLIRLGTPKGLRLSCSTMSTIHYPKVVTYEVCIHPVGAPFPNAGFFEATFKKRFPSASMSILDIAMQPEALKKKLEQAEVLVTSPADLTRMMDYIPNVKWVQVTYAGYDPLTNYLKQTSNFPNIKITRMGGVFGVRMAEYVLGYIIAHERNFEGMREQQKCQRWNYEKFKTYRELSELTIAIIGAGDIGCQVAKYCKSVGMRTIGVVTRERRPHERSEFIDEYRLTSDVLDVCGECDVLCNLLPSSPDTIDFYKEECFRSCTKKPLFINVGRGDAVKSETVIKALRNGWISGAVLDVFNQEPLPEDSELWNTPGVTITPHNSGITTEKEMVDLFTTNYERFIRGEDMKYEIDLAKLMAKNRDS